MNLDQITSHQLVQNAKKGAIAFFDVGQKHFNGTLNLYRSHGKQLLNESKAFYQDLRSLQRDAVNDLRKVIDDQKNAAAAPQEASTSNKGTKKKAPKKPATKGKTEDQKAAAATDTVEAPAEPEKAPASEAAATASPEA